MLIKCSTALSFLCLLLVWTGVCIGTTTAQQSVGILRTELTRKVPPNKRMAVADEVEPFSFERNLIFFEALVNDRPGKFILDTGAPTLIVNNRGNSLPAQNNKTGIGAGGTVALTDQKLQSFEMGGRRVDNYWALGIDLRSMELRTNQRIDGFVGYDFLKEGELRIDYEGKTFQLKESQRKPTHRGVAPRAVLRFTLVDHLPVIMLRSGRKKLYFALDTGAGSNLIDHRLSEQGDIVQQTDRRINIQGLDGNDAAYDVVTMSAGTLLPGNSQVELVSMDIDHLQTPGGLQLDGILGSGFLSNYTVGIDYRRRRVYLW